MMFNLRREPYLAFDGEHLGDMVEGESRRVDIKLPKHSTSPQIVSTGPGISCVDEGKNIVVIDGALNLLVTADTVGTYRIMMQGAGGDKLSKLIRVYP